MKVTASIRNGFAPQLMRSVSIMRMSAPSLIQFLSQHNNPCLQLSAMPVLSHEVPPTIRQQLQDECAQTPLTQEQHTLLAWLIECVEDDGFLYLPDELPLPAKDMEAGICLLQKIAPAGVAARTAAERLLLQLQQTTATPVRQTALDLVTRHWHWLQRKRWDKLPQKNLMPALALIESLPPVTIPDGTAAPSLPDLLIVEKRGLRRALPAIGSNFSAAAVRNGSFADWREAKEIAAAVTARRHWLLRAGQYVADFQSDFFRRDVSALQPLPMKKAAHDLKISTAMLSHIICGKRFIFSGGEFTLKYLYGCNTSSTILQYKIQQMIADESPRHPLSDERLRLALHREDIFLSRRTIAKHRGLAKIPAAPLRKRAGG